MMDQYIYIYGWITCFVISVSGTFLGNIWGFPEIGLPPNHPLLVGTFHFQSTIQLYQLWGFPIFGNPHWYMYICRNSLPRFCIGQPPLPRSFLGLVGSTWILYTGTGGTGFLQLFTELLSFHLRLPNDGHFSIVHYS